MRFIMTQEDIDESVQDLRDGKFVGCSNCPIARCILRRGFRNVSIDGAGRWQVDIFSGDQTPTMENFRIAFDHEKVKKQFGNFPKPIIFNIKIPNSTLEYLSNGERM